MDTSKLMSGTNYVNLLSAIDAFQTAVKNVSAAEAALSAAQSKAYEAREGVKRAAIGVYEKSKGQSYEH